jgi:glucokinase
LNSLITVINEILSYAYDRYKIKIDNACIAVAGIVSSQDNVKITNANWSINLKELLQKTSINSAFLINDFQAIGYGVNIFNHEDINNVFTIKSSNNKNLETKTKAIIGAGTGLGKSILIFDKNLNFYIPKPSEGGHSDFPAQDDFEFELINYIKKNRNISQPVTYEELLSGRGLEIIYLFLEEYEKYDENNYSKEINKSSDKVAIIAKYRNNDELCSKTFKIFSKFYGRCAKNFALDTLAIGGLYIAGGIASKNIEIFKTKEFISEFENAYRRTEILKEIPIYAILDYDVGLKGACFAAKNWSKIKNLI